MYLSGLVSVAMNLRATQMMVIFLTSIVTASFAKGALLYRASHRPKCCR